MSQSRKVLIRVMGAPLLLAALAGVFYLDYVLQRPLAVTVLAGLFAVLSYRELCAMARLRGLNAAEDLGSLALSLVFAGIFAFWWRDAAWPMELVPLAYLVVLLLRLVFRYGRFSPGDAGYSMLAWGYVLLLAFVLQPPRNLGGGQMWVYLLFLVATNKGSDMAAYVFGKLFGRHKMAPVVSPNKTWEGAVGGLVVGAGLGAILLEHSALKPALGNPPVWALALVAVAVTIAAQAGDLVKSAMKRWAGVKDSGRILPEFGGALDMCDSFILSAPVAWIALQLL